MTRRRLNIGIRTKAEGKKALRTAFEKVRRGDFTPQEPGLYFETMEDLRRILTDKRLDLLLAITQHQPRSVRELASRIERDYKNVSTDVELLRQLGLVELEEREGRGGPKVPTVPYDEIHVTIALHRQGEAKAA
jgi:predicted transcriptional regulator